MKFQTRLRLILCVSFYLMGYFAMTQPVAFVRADPGDLDTTFGVDNNADGVMDGYYESEIGSNAFDLALQSTGNIFVVGGLSGCSSSMAYMGQIARLTNLGVLDESFANVSYRYTTDTTEAALFYGISKDSSDNIYATGFRWPNSSTKDLVIAKYSADGVADTTFNSAAFYDSGFGDDTGRDVVVDSLGSLIVVGDVSESTGTPDMFIGKFNQSTGALETSLVHTYKANGYDRLYGVALDYNDDLTDYSVVTVGYTVNESGGIDSAILKLKSTLELDAEFDGDGYRTIDILALGAEDVAKAVVMDSQGNIYFTGFVENESGNRDIYVAKLSSSGAPDTTFGTLGTGYVILDSGYGDDEGYSLAIDSQNSIVVSGEMANSAGVSSLFVARFDSLGVLDTKFGQANGAEKLGYSLITKEELCSTAMFTSVTLDANQDIIAAGGCYEISDDAPTAEEAIIAKFDGGHLTCGDSVVSTGEECDDGGVEDNDSCSSSCLTQTDADGDTYFGANDCDDTDASIHENCASDGTDGDGDADPSCGDNHVDEGEECDDGNFTAGDMCSAVCTLELDEDRDGYYGEADCDDADASVHVDCPSASESTGSSGGGCGCVISKQNANPFESLLYGSVLLSLALVRFFKKNLAK